MDWLAERVNPLSRVVIAIAAAFALMFSINLNVLAAAHSKYPLAETVEGIAAYNSGNYAMAFLLLRSAASHGDSDAEVNLGYMYARGQGVPIDQAEALRLYRLSAESGNGEGMNAMAYKYTYGTGVPVDMSIAVRWYCRAIAMGNPRALNNLVLLHAQGQGVPFDMDEARDLWRQAAALDHANAMFNLGMSAVDGKPWIIRAAQLGQPLAIDWLRSNGYEGPLPEPIDTTGRMALAPPKAPSGNAKECAVS